MSSNKWTVALGFVWLSGITGLHLWLNFDWKSFLNDFRPVAERRLHVAYVPVT